MKTYQDFLNAGYSPKRAREFSQSPAHNWQADNGGKRGPVDFKKIPAFTDSVKQSKP